MGRPRKETDIVATFRSARVLTLDDLGHRSSPVPLLPPWVPARGGGPMRRPSDHREGPLGIAR